MNKLSISPDNESQEKSMASQSGVQAITDKQKQSISELKECLTSPVPASYWRSLTYKLELEEALKERYEGLN